MIEEDITMENNFDNAPENTNEEANSQKEENTGAHGTDPQSRQYTYTDPNEGYSQNSTYGQDAAPGQYGYNGNSSSQNSRGSYQDNYNYNVGNNEGYNTSYDTGMDQSPMSMGDWLLTILIMTFIPCVGIILYFVWAFGKNGNINRRNYCRAYLIIMGIAVLLAIIFLFIFGVASIGTYRYY